MTDAQASPTILAKLKDARTLGDVYAIDFPHVVGLISDVDAFTDLPDFTPRVYGRAEKDAVIWDREPSPAVREATGLIDAFEASAGHTVPQRWDMDVIRAQNVANTSIICSLHMDGPHEPRMRVYFAASEKPTWVVPHAAIRDILRENAGHILYHPIDGGYLESLQMASQNLEDHFRCAARRVPANTLMVMSGVTFHFRDQSVSNQRAFVRARGFNA